MGYGEDKEYGKGFYKGVSFDFLATTTTGTAPFTVKFTLQSNTVFNYHWYFGDGHESSERNPVHVYGMPGTYTVRLKAEETGSNLDEIKNDYITVTDWDATFNVATTDKSIRFAVEEQQGRGISENASSGWVFPEGRVSSVNVKDNLNRFHTLISDATDGKIYEIGLVNGPTGSSEVLYWKDRVSGDGTGGIDISQSVTFKEDHGEYEKFVTEHLKSRFNIRTQNNDYLDAAGYDPSGFPDGLELDAYVYLDGVANKVTARARDFTKNGEVVFDRKVEAHRTQLKMAANKAPFRLTSRQQDYVTKDIDTFDDGVRTTETDNQSEIANVLIWATRGSDMTKERVNASSITGIAGYTTGPDGKSNSAYSTSGLTISGASGTFNKSYSFWTDGTISSFTIGGNSVTPGSYSGNGNNWTLYSGSGVTDTGQIVLTPSGTVGLFDFRLISGNLDNKDGRYMFEDVTENKADNICPLF